MSCACVKKEGILEESYMEKIEKILVPTDFSSNAERAVSYGITFAQSLKAKLFLLHVVHDLQGYIGFYVTNLPLSQLQKDLENEANQKMHALCNRYLTGPIDYESRVVTGIPILKILDWAKEIDADMIILGAKGNARPEHTFFGSVAERVVEKASCPVMIVREAEEP